MNEPSFQVTGHLGTIAVQLFVWHVCFVYLSWSHWHQGPNSPQEVLDMAANARSGGPAEGKHGKRK